MRGRRRGRRPAAGRAEHRVSRQARERPPRTADRRWLERWAGDAYKAAASASGQREGQFKPAVLQYKRPAPCPFDSYCNSVNALNPDVDPHRIREFSGSRCKDLRIPFKVAFRHASADGPRRPVCGSKRSRDCGVVGSGESCPRPYVTGESIESAQGVLSRGTRRRSREQMVDLDSLRAWMSRTRDELDANPAAWCAIELAILDAGQGVPRQQIERLAGAAARSPAASDTARCSATCA